MQIINDTWKTGKYYKLYHGPAQNIALSDQYDCIVTSPPYYQMRWSETDDALEIGNEETVETYLQSLIDVFANLVPQLKDTGNVFINLGDKMLKKRQLLLPHRLALRLEEEKLLTLHQEIIWLKSNNMPNSHHDRLTMRTESFLWMVKDPKKFYHNVDPLREPHKTKEILGNTSKEIAQESKYASAEKAGKLGSPRARAKREKAVNYYHDGGRNPGNVWTIPTEKFSGTHFSVMPSELAKRAIHLGCPPEGTVLDPFNGAGTSMLAARQLNRKYIGVDVSEKYLKITLDRALKVQVELDGFVW